MDAEWFPPNVWPAEVPELRERCRGVPGRDGRGLAGPAGAARRAPSACPRDFLPRTWPPDLRLQHQLVPGARRSGEPEPGQFRIGPHTDFGTVTILDRQAGKGGLQVYTDGGGWEDAPYDPDAFTINIGDLMARWTGDRWRSGRHRVLPPPADAPAEELMSLVYFFELDHDALVTPLAPPIGRRSGLEPVVSAPFLKERLDAISVR